MKTKQSLFDEGAEPSDGHSAPSTLLVIAGQSLGPEQQLFNQLLTKLEKQKLALHDFAELAQTYRVEYSRKIGPLEEQKRALSRDMVLFLDQRLLNAKGLSKKVRANMAEILCGLVQGLMHGPHAAEMQPIYERHSAGDVDDSTAEAEAAAAMQAMMEDLFGIDMQGQEGLDSPEQILAAAMQKIHEQEQAQAERQAAKKARRKKTPKQAQAAQEDLDAGKALRDIYRQLASALHPDREPDERERLRKTELMVEVNVANEKKDLLALLQLQLKVEQIDPGTVAMMAQDKLRHFNRVLKDQLQSLQTELLLSQQQFRHEFDLTFGAITQRSLQTALRSQAQRQEADLAWMRKDVQLIQTDDGLKSWVIEQVELMDDPFDDFGDMDDFDWFDEPSFVPGRSKRR